MEDLKFAITLSPVPRRILLLVTDLELGGTPTVVRELATRLRSPSVHVAIACLGRPGPVADQLLARGVPVTALGATSPFDLRILPKFLRLIARERPDTILSFLIHANAIAAAASLFFPRIRFLQSIQTTQPRPAWHWALQRILRHAAGRGRIIVPSPSIAAVAMQRSGVPAAMIDIIPNAIDPADFPPVPRPPGSRTIGFIGRLDPVKRIPDLLHAMTFLPDVRLEIFGEGPQRPVLAALIGRLNLAGRVTLRGPIARPQDALAQLDLLVLPSEAEGLPMVLLEAMAAAVPIVATDAPGIRDCVRHDHSALLVPVGRPAALAAAITQILADPTLRSRLIRQASHDIRQHFSWPAVLPRYQQLLWGAADDILSS